MAHDNDDLTQDEYLEAAIYAVLRVYSDLNVSATGRLFLETIRGEIAERWMLREDDMHDAIDRLADSKLLVRIDDPEGELLELTAAGAGRVRSIRPPRNWREIKRKSQTFWTVAKLAKRGKERLDGAPASLRRRKADEIRVA